MLEDFDINGTFVPGWVANNGLMLENGQISKNEFMMMLKYLNTIGIVR